MLDHTLFSIGVIIISIAVIGTAIELHIASKIVRNERLKKFLYRGAILLYIYFGTRAIGYIIDEVVFPQYSQVWALLIATIGFWLSTFLAARILRNGIVKQRDNREEIHITEIVTSRRTSLVADIDNLLCDIEQGKVTLNSLPHMT